MENIQVFLLICLITLFVIHLMNKKENFISQQQQQLDQAFNKFNSTSKPNNNQSDSRVYVDGTCNLCVAELPSDDLDTLKDTSNDLISPIDTSVKSHPFIPLPKPVIFNCPADCQTQNDCSTGDGKKGIRCSK